jgi:hypothetical protein
MKTSEGTMTGIRVGFLTAALLGVASTAEAQRSDRDGVRDGRIPVILDGRIPVITDGRGRDARVEDPRLYFARERDKCQRHVARANWWRARGLRGHPNAQRQVLHETRKAERCFDRLFAKQQKQALRDARRANRNRDDVFGVGRSSGRTDNGRGALARGNGNRGRGRGNR